MKTETPRLFFRKLVDDLFQVKWAVALLLIYILLTQFLFGEFCPLRIVIGLPCPCCGITRAIWALLHLDIATAFYLNPLVFLWIFYIGYLFYNRYISNAQRSFSNTLLIVVCLTSILYYFYAMIQYFPNQEPFTYYSGNLLLRTWQLMN